MEPNPPDVAPIDYYVGSAQTLVVISITDASGHTVRRWSSADDVHAVDPSKLTIPAYWVHPQLPPSAARGAHRWYWNYQYADRVLAPPGTYAVRLMVDGKTYSAPLTLKRDPTSPAGDADLRAQFELAQQIVTKSQAAAAPWNAPECW